MSAYLRLISTFLLLVFFSAFAKTYGQGVSPQEFTDWAVRNGFEAGEDWRSYLLIAPGNMGPNALPVMACIRGEADSVASFSVSGNFHYATGDRANDLAAELRYPVSDRASLRIRYVLAEWYSMSEELALQRNVLRGDLTGIAYGDVVVDGLFQVVKEHAKFPDVTITMRLKTASGTDLEALRFTDTPGYAFEASFGKEYDLKAHDISLRPYASAGFYVWQRFNRQTPQNDAYTYSVGCAQRFKKVDSYVEWAGYSGWIQSLDQPMLVRGGISTTGPIAIQLTASKGLRDFDYLSLGLGISYAW